MNVAGRRLWSAQAMADDHVGIELRLDVDPSGTDELIRSELLGLTAEPEIVDCVYFDTLEACLRAAGFSLRIRHDGYRRIQILEANTAATAALFVLPRWESEVRGDEPVVAALPLAGLVDSDALARLRPQFRIKTTRIAGQVRRDGAVIHVAVDRGQVMDGGRAAPIDEVRLGLERGDPRALFDLAREIDGTVPVRIGVLNAPDRGYRLIDRTAEAAARAEPVALDARMSAAVGFQHIARECLRQFRLNDALLLERNAQAALHEARVALRRLRAAMKLFRSILKHDPQSEALRRDVRWLASELGPARNLDVLRPHIDDRGIGAEVDRVRSEAYDRARTSLASPRARRLMLDLSEWIAIGRWLTDPREPAELDRPIAALAAAALDRALRRLVKGARDLGDAKQLHKMRIRTKALRYAIDFFEPLYRRGRDARRLRRMAERIERLQALLGTVTDYHMRHATLAALCLSDYPDDADARDVQHALSKARRQLAALVKREPFWG